MPALFSRILRRGIEAAHVVGWCGADGPSKRRLLGAYTALARRVWSPAPVDTRLRIGETVVSLRFRQRDVYVIGEILHDRLYRIRSDLPARPVVVDAGANIGVSALWLTSHYPGAQIHCFEPELTNFELLRHNLQQLSGARCEQAALGAFTGPIPFYVTETEANHSIFDPEVPARVEVVRCVRLGDYLQANHLKRVDLLKLDVEGSELAALEGLGEQIERVAVIVGEFHERLVNEGAFYSFLRHCGFRVVAKWPVHHSKGQHMFEVAR